ncbi:acetolactate synthase 2 small subunit [Colwellia sp. MEBiC06753]
MQQHTLRISAAQQPTVLERLLQVTRYRGFNVTGITMYPQVETNSYDIELNVASEHSIEHLCSQLQKLFDVNEINIEQNNMMQCRA